MSHKILENSLDLYILWVVAGGVASLIFFCIAIFGVYWKISSRRNSDMEKLHLKIDALGKDLNEKLSQKIGEIYKQVNKDKELNDSKIEKLNKDIGVCEGQLKRIE